MYIFSRTIVETLARSLARSVGRSRKRSSGLKGYRMTLSSACTMTMMTTTMTTTLFFSPYTGAHTSYARPVASSCRRVVLAGSMFLLRELPSGPLFGGLPACLPACVCSLRGQPACSSVVRLRGLFARSFVLFLAVSRSVARSVPFTRNRCSASSRIVVRSPRKERSDTTSAAAAAAAAAVVLTRCRSFFRPFVSSSFSLFVQCLFIQTSSACQLVAGE